METKINIKRYPLFPVLENLRQHGLLCACLALLVFLPASLFAQEHNTTGDWFLKDRILPYDSIPPDAYKTAVDKQWDMRQSEGYSAGPELAVWSNIGPTNAYKNGRVVRVKYDPTNQNIVYICAHNGGVWRSDNAQIEPSSNVSFNWKTKDLQTQSSGDIAIDPQQPSTIYYGTGGNVFCFGYNYYGIGVYKSTDRGENWTGPFTNGLPSIIFTSTIVVNPVNHDVYLANGCSTGPYCTGTGAGLYKSTNGGQSWTKVVPINGYESCYDVVISENGLNIYAVTNTRYFRSTNGGLSFFEYPEGITNLFQNGRTQIAISKRNNNYIYLVTDNTTNHHNYAYVSTNGGYSFSTPPFDLGPDVDCMTLDFFFVQASPILNHEQEAFVGWGGGGYGMLKRTTNGGVSYQSVNVGGIDHNNFAFNPVNPNQGISCNDEGLYISNNILNTTSVEWNSLNYSLSVRENYRVATNPFDANDMVIAVTDAGFFKYNGGISWTETHTGCDGTSVIHTKLASPDVFIAGKGVDWACSNFNGTFTSTNGGTQWQYHPNLSWSFWDANVDWIGTFDENFDSPGTFFHPRRRHNGQNPPGPTEIIDINKSTNNGATWIPYQQNTITPIQTGDPSYSPQSISVSDDNPQIMYVSTKRWLSNQPRLSQVWRTMDGGQTPWFNLDITNHGVPNRVVTNVVADPCHENVVYLTLSGFGSGHVFKSTNYGTNWKDISNPPSPGQGSFPPDLPVNYLIVDPLTSTQNRLFIATDAGVYTTLDPDRLHIYGYYWTEVAEGLPNTVCLGLDFNKLSNKLRAALFGRGVWEVTLQDQIYLTCGQILSSTEQGLDVANDIVVDSGATLTIPSAATIRFPAGKKLIIQEGSQINVTSNEPVYFTSQSGSWGGIEIQDGGYGTIKNCVFNNTETPIVISSQRDGGNSILVQNCIFSNGSVTVNGRDNVTIMQCTTNTASASTGTGINAVYSDNLVLSQNTINNCWGAGIMVSNSSPVILSNVINHAEETNSAAGISLDNCYSGTVNYNQVYNCNYGIYLYYSSPTMLENIMVNNTTSSSAPCALYANYLSSPRLKPTSGDLGTIWDAGINELKTNNDGSGIYMYDVSIPNIDYGYNKIYGYDYHLSGEIGNGELNEYYAIDNCWAPNYPPLRENISDATVYEDPYTCDPPGGGAESGDDPASVAEDELLPPPPIIINYGNGIFDTIRVTSQQYPLSADQLLFSQGLDAEIAGNYQVAINKYIQVVQNYQDSNTAIGSMKKILYCNDKMHASVNIYSALRTYYQNLAQQNPSDTGFVKASKEMASKCLVRIGQFPDAITEYETVAQNSNDSLEVLCAELNIIETYMIMEQGGDLPGFTGQLKQLKPASVLDGIRLINEKLHRFQPNKTKPLVPDVFSLSQNYPNPFNPLTKINYAIPKRTNVTLKIYDILGRLVKTLVNEHKEPGYYTVQFDGSALASGVYFYTIEAGDFVQSKKMILVK